MRTPRSSRGTPLCKLSGSLSQPGMHACMQSHHLMRAHACDGPHVVGMHALAAVALARKQNTRHTPRDLPPNRGSCRGRRHALGQHLPSASPAATPLRLPGRGMEDGPPLPGFQQAQAEFDAEIDQILARRARRCWLAAGVVAVVLLALLASWPAGACRPPSSTKLCRAGAPARAVAPVSAPGTWRGPWAAGQMLPPLAPAPRNHLP